MKYFRYDRLRAAAIYSPIDAKGRAVDVLYGGRSEEFGYVSVTSLTEAHLQIQDPSELKDCLYCPSSYLLISERLCLALKTFPLDDAIDFLPVHVTAQERVATYVLLHSGKGRDPFDHEQAQYDYFPQRPGVVRAVKKYAFDATKLPPFALFRTKQFDWIMNESLVSHLAPHHFTGHSFQEIWDDSRGG